MHVCVDGRGGLGCVEGLGEEGAEDGEAVAVFLLHGGFHVFSVRGDEVSFVRTCQLEENWGKLDGAGRELA